MDSIHGGIGTFWITGFIGLFILPLVTVFQPVLPLALALTLVLSGYVTIAVGMEQATTTVQRGVGGVTAVVLALHGALYGVAVGLLLYFLIEWTGFRRKRATDTSLDQAHTEAALEQPGGESRSGETTRRPGSDGP